MVKISKKQIIGRFVLNFIRRLKRHHIMEKSAELAYFFLLSLFPFLILLNTAVAALNIPPDIINRLLSPLFPKEVTNLIVQYNAHIIHNTSTAAVSLGILFVLYSASKAVRTLNKAFVFAYGVLKKLSYVRMVVLSVAATFGLGIISALSVALLVFASAPINSFLQSVNPFFIAMPLLKAIAALFLLTVSVIVLNLIHYIAAFGKIRFRRLLPGSILSVIFVCIASFGFAIYFNNFSNFSAVYGAISAVMLLVLWLYLFSIVILAGAEFNAELMAQRKSG